MSTSDEIEKYYDDVTGVYLRIYGNVIQAFRPKSEKRLLRYLGSSIGLQRGMQILDAGCGVCGPAVFFAKKYGVKIDAVTLSGEQVGIAGRNIRSRGVEHLVEVRKGDYHELTSYYKDRRYDGVIFLESMGHAQDARKVIREAAALVRDGGFIYIKDFFRKESADAAFQEKVDVVIERMNRHYCYNTLQLAPVIAELRRQDFEIEFIRKFDFNDDTTVRAQFELDQGIDIFEGYDEFWPAEWLELKFVKQRF